MRILQIVYNRIGQGTYWRAFHLGRALVERGHQVTLMAMSSQSRFQLRAAQTQGLRLIETPDWMPGSLRSGWDIWDTARRMFWLRSEAFDLVHAFETRPVVIFPALQARDKGARLVLDWADWFGRGGMVEERPNRLVRAMLRPVETYFEEHYRRQPEATTVISNCLLERAVELGVSRDSILLLRNGCDATIQPLGQMEARRVVGLPLDQPLIGFAGGTFWRDAALMAAALNHLSRLKPEAKLILVGNFNRDIETMLNDPNMVIRTGSLKYEQMFGYLAACDLCWLPLRNSGANKARWPMKLNDYMTAGRPVVGTAVGDVGELIPKWAIGIVTQDNPSEFASRTAELLDDPSRREVMGEAALRVAGEYGWDKLAGRLEAFVNR